MTILYLEKDNDELVSHCACEAALITFPPQQGCPWCGCGWLFTCIECRKAFSFARGVRVEGTWEELAIRDLTNQWGSEPSKDEVQEWVATMKELLKDVEEGEQYVCLDGKLIPTDARSLEYFGWHSKHSLDHVPHVTALSNPAVVDDILKNVSYWSERSYSVDE